MPRSAVAVLAPIVTDKPWGIGILGADIDADIKGHNADLDIASGRTGRQQQIDHVRCGAAQGLDLAVPAHGAGVVEHHGQLDLGGAVNGLALGTDGEMIDANQTGQGRVHFRGDIQMHAILVGQFGCNDLVLRSQGLAFHIGQEKGLGAFLQILGGDVRVPCRGQCGCVGGGIQLGAQIDSAVEINADANQRDDRHQCQGKIDRHTAPGVIEQCGKACPDKGAGGHGKHSLLKRAPCQTNLKPGLTNRLARRLIAGGARTRGAYQA